MKWMDLLRGFSVIFIVMYHAAAIPSLHANIEAPHIIDMLNNALSPFRIPALLIISGLLLDRSRSKGAVRYIKGKFRNIAWPYAIWFISIILVFYENSNLRNIGSWMDGKILWYLPTIGFCYLVGLIRIPKLPWWTISLVFLGVYFLGDISGSVYRRWLWFGAYFFIGASLAKYLDFILHRMPRWVTGVLLLITLGTSAHSLVTGYAEKNLLNFTASVAGVVLLIKIAYYLQNISTKFFRFLKFAGKNSIIFYVAHPIAMYLSLLAFEAAGVSHWMIVDLTCLIAALSLCMLLAMHRSVTDFLFVAPWSKRKSRVTASA